MTSTGVISVTSTPIINIFSTRVSLDTMTSTGVVSVTSTPIINIFSTRVSLDTMTSTGVVSVTSTPTIKSTILKLSYYRSAFGSDTKMHCFIAQFWEKKSFIRNVNLLIHF